MPNSGVPLASALILSEIQYSVAALATIRRLNGTADMSSYEELPGLDVVYLEDSFVLAIREGPHELMFELDAVLTPRSPAYAPPPEDEQYCYRRAKLIFRGADITWLARSEARYTDASGREDLGNIDVFTAQGQRYYLEGDWGSVQIETNERPRFELSSG